MHFSDDNTFDCNSLPVFNNKTVTLRLPGAHDIKDVFWFSIFSMKQGISLSHIYLPYNDMQLPPDLNGIAVSLLVESHYRTFSVTPRSGPRIPDFQN